MSILNFASPHCHQQSLDTGSTPEAFAKREVELGTGFLTVTDHGSLAGCPKVYKLAKENKLTPILGLEGYFRDDDCQILTDAGIVKGADGTFSEYNKYYHLTMHALDQTAYEAMVRILSKADGRAEQHGTERKPLFTWANLEELGSYNITLTSGCLVGMVQRHLMSGKPDIAIKYYNKLRSITKPGNFMVEVFPHRCDKNWESGVFLTLEGGTKVRYYAGKTLRTNVGEIKALELSKVWTKGKHTHLVAVKNYGKWEDVFVRQILRVEHVEDFLQNECKPWAPDGDYQLGANRFMLRLADKNHDKVLISDDSHFANPEEKIVQDIKLLQGSGGVASWRFYGSYHRQSSDEAFQYFDKFMGIPQAKFEGWVQNSYEWGNRFKDFTLKPHQSLPVSFYPKDTLGHTMELIKRHGRMDWKNKEYVARLNKEIKLLHNNGTIDLLPYFMIDEEVAALYAKEGLLTGAGRGSAAGLLLAYLLGITHVDPLKYGLSVDRFLTKSRIESGKLPDIDQDLPHRDLLVGKDGTGATGFLRDRFGENFAQISVVTTLKLKSSIKDVARVIHGGHVPSDIEALVTKMPVPPQGISDADFVFGYEGNDGWVEGVIDSDQYLQAYVKAYPSEWEIVQLCLGVQRSSGRHACAFVIADEPISNFIPRTTIGGVSVTSYSAPGVEAVGGLKMDFLVIDILNDISDCLKLVQRRHMKDVNPEGYRVNGKYVPPFYVVPSPVDGSPMDVWDLPEDQAVFKDISGGKTESTFQFGAASAKQWLAQFDHEKLHDSSRKALDSIESISAFTALDRPGPLDAYVSCECHSTQTAPGQHNMLVEYARRARGEEGVGSHPILNKLFPETYGIIVYQEQLQKAFQEIGKTTAQEADDFRTHISKKQMGKVLKDKDIFMRGAPETVGPEAAQVLWDSMYTFGQYGFNKSHAVCYAMTGYVCAYLKHHYPLEWWCAVLQNADKNEINEKFWSYCGHLIDLPDLQLSAPRFEIVGERIRAPLSLLQGVGAAAHAELCMHAPKVKTVEDFCRVILEYKTENAKTKPDGKVSLGRSAITRKTVYTLIVAGAMDSLFPPETNILDKFQMYEAAKAASESVGKKRPKKPAPVDPRFIDMTPLTRFQTRKAILPAFSTPLLPLIMPYNSNLTDEARGITFRWYDPRQQETRAVKVVSNTELDKFEAHKPWPEDLSITVAVPAYIVEDERRQFGPAKKNMAKLTLDVDGTRYTLVKWPDKQGALPESTPASLKGYVVLAVLRKWTGSKPFSIDDIVVIQPPLDSKDEESSGEEQ